MDRRTFLTGSAIAGLSLMAQGRRLSAQTMGSEADPSPIGPNKIEIIHQTKNGNVVLSDSLLYIYNDNITADDVLVVGSYCGAATLPHAFKKGIKAMIAHDAGVGKENAGISALPLGEQHDIPVAAVGCMSASISNGRSMAEGIISHANAQARALGVKPGQNAAEAAKLLLAAKPGRVNETEVPFDKTVHEKGTLNGGRIFVSSGLIYLPQGQDYSKDVFCSGTHSGSVFAELMSKWRVKGWISNDAGMAKNNSGIGGLPLCADMGIAAAAVDCMSARIGDALNTYDEGVISVANTVALDMGVKVGMKGSEALRAMLG